jgi:release factor glutamine methyltransferase
MNALLRVFMRCAYLPALRAVGRRRLRRLVLERLDGVPLLVLPDVFHPTVFLSSALLVRTLAKCVPAGEDTGRALDMGTGSGVGAVFAARHGYRVTAVDINPEAVRCARINALLNHLDDRIEAREGDLFAPVEGETFDLVLFNPPFFRGTPKDALDRAWRATDVLERFAAGLPSALTPEGRALIVLSSDGDEAGLLTALQAVNMVTTPVAQRDFGNGILTVYAAHLPK